MSQLHRPTLTTTTRRTLLKTAAWVAPAVSLTALAPAASASTPTEQGALYFSDFRSKRFGIGEAGIITFYGVIGATANPADQQTTTQYGPVSLNVSFPGQIAGNAGNAIELLGGSGWSNLGHSEGRYHLQWTPVQATGIPIGPFLFVIPSWTANTPGDFSASAIASAANFTPAETSSPITLSESEEDAKTF